jgi:hypothetical protein
VLHHSIAWNGLYWERSATIRGQSHDEWLKSDSFRKMAQQIDSKWSSRQGRLHHLGEAQPKLPSLFRSQMPEMKNLTAK